MNEYRMRKQVRQAVEQKCAFLQPNPYLAQRVLNAAEKTSYRKAKKTMWGLVLLVALMLAAVSAVAAISLKGLHEKAIEFEGENSLVAEWSSEQRISFVDRMIDAGIELDASKVEQLHSEEMTLWAKDAIALQLILDYYPSRDGSLSTADIIAKEKGPAETWSADDKGWYAERQSFFHPDHVRESRFLLPDQAELSQYDAFAIFTQCLSEQFKITEKEIDLSTLSASFGEYTFDSGNGPRKLRGWYFCVQLANGNEALAYIDDHEGAPIHLSVSQYD